MNFRSESLSVFRRLLYVYLVGLLQSFSARLVIARRQPTLPLAALNSALGILSPWPGLARKGKDRAEEADSWLTGEFHFNFADSHRGFLIQLSDGAWLLGCSHAPTHERTPVMSRAHGTIQLQSPEMGKEKLQNGAPNQSRDEGTIASKGVGNQRHRDKHNLGYVLRTGLAGGLAGCAVCTFNLLKRRPC